MAIIKQQIYTSETKGQRPAAANVREGELWQNIADKVIGTKSSDGTIHEYAQLTPDERTVALAAMPKTGLVSGVTMGTKAAAEDNTIVISDTSETTLSAVLASAPTTITINRTTGHKITKLVITKPVNVTSQLTWTGVDQWLSTIEAPIFGASTEEQELCVAIFSSPSKNVVNVLYNTETPTEIDTADIQWGKITGNLNSQADLAAALSLKADTTALADYPTRTEMTTELGKKLDTSAAFTQAQADALYIAASKESMFATTSALNNGLATKLGINDKAKSAETADSVDGANVIGQVNSAKSADSATKAAQDASGNVITTTYAAKSEIPDLAPYALTSAVNAGLATKLDTSAAFTKTQADALYLGKTATAAAATQDGQGNVIATTYAKAATTYTKTEVDAKVSAVYKYKGSVANEAALPTTGQTIGDVYNVEDTGSNVAWDGTKWDHLGEIVDLSPYLTINAAGQTYATQAALNSGLSAKLDASAAFTQTQADALYLGINAKAASAASADSVAGTNVVGAVAAATKATQDASGNVITTTYATKAENNAKLDATAKAASATVADSAAKLSTAHTISISGAVTGTATAFNGTADITISATALNPSNLSDAVPLAKGGTGSTTAAGALSNLGGIAKSGNRGMTAGYESCGSAATINQDSEDASETASAVTVQNGTAGTTWTKIVHMTAASPTATLGSNWSWLGGSVPTFSQGGFLVLCWCGSNGIASFNAIK